MAAEWHRKMSGSGFTSCSGNRQHQASAPARPGSAIHHQVEGLFTAGVKVPGTCLRALSEEPLLLKRTPSMQRAW